MFQIKNRNLYEIVKSNWMRPCVRPVHSHHPSPSVLRLVSGRKGEDLLLGQEIVDI